MTALPYPYDYPALPEYMRAVKPVRAEWDLCREEHRKYSIRFRMLDSGGEVITVDVLAIPVPESPPAKQWLGVIRRVVE